MKMFETEIIKEIFKDEYDYLYYFTQDEKTKKYFLYKRSIYFNNFATVEKGLVKISNYIIENNLVRA